MTDINTDQPKMTALTTILLLAAHQRFDGEPKVLTDQVSVDLLGADDWARIDALPGGLNSPLMRHLRSAFLLRSRLAEDELAVAATQGVHQYVMLGAGLDTFAFRQPAFAADLHIFEVDYPATQAWKRARFAASGYAEPANLHWVPTDFEEGRLPEALATAGFDPGHPACISWLGVTQYLTKPTINTVLSWAASLPHPTTLVLTFIVREEDVSGEDLATIEIAVRVAAERGEPWLTRVQPESMRAWLTEVGFARVFLLSPQEADERYFGARDDGLQAPGYMLLATATT
jgi:methyltransferase (TIGR00027 family)